MHPSNGSRRGTYPEPPPPLARRDPTPWLSSRVVLSGALALAGAVVLVATAFVGFEQRELQASTLARDELFARVLEDQANRTLASVDLALGAATEGVRLLRSSGDAAPLSALLQQSIHALPFLRSISLLDGQGRVLASSNADNVGQVVDRQRLVGANSRPGLGPLLAGRDLVDLAKPPTGAAPAGAGELISLLPMVQALQPQQPGAQGEWLVAAINPDYFANQYELLLGDAGQRAALLAYDGQLIAASMGVNLPVGRRVPTHKVFTDFLPSREQGEFVGPGLDGSEAYTAFRSARRQPLVLVVETPSATVAAQLQATALKVAGATLGLLTVLGALATLVWRSLRSREAVSGDLAAARGNLAAKDAFTDRLFEVSPIPMVVKDTAGRFVRVNKAWTDLTGLATERVIGANLGRLYPAQLAAPHEVQEQMAIVSGQPVNYEEQLLDSDGLPRDVMIRVMPFTDAGGQVTGVISCLTDVTEFREAAQRTLEAKNAAEHANSTKSEFLANISHELRTPLQGILGFSELGSARSRADVRLNGMFGDIHSAGQRMLTLVNNLLDLSRLESTVGEIHLSPVAVVPLLRAVVQELRQMALTRKLALVAPLAYAGSADPAAPDAARSLSGLNMPPAAPGDADANSLWAAADGFRLQQVLRNVLANAIRFAPAGSVITIDWGLADGGREILVSVRDHGPGIPADELESIFESFVQSSRTKDGSGGTGLGLAICRKIMAAHRGRIAARNHPEGGALFEIRLPALVRPVAVVAAPGVHAGSDRPPAGPAAQPADSPRSATVAGRAAGRG